MFEKEKIYEITKDFGDNCLSSVFVMEENNAETENVAEQMQDAINKAKKICLVCENAFSRKLVESLADAAKNETRIYVLVPQIDESRFILLKDKAIVRAVPGIQGNFLLCIEENEGEKIAAFFFDKEMNGKKITGEAAEKLSEFFIYQFWNNAKKEFVSKIEDVKGKTFDVYPVFSEESERPNFLVNYSVAETNPMQELLQKLQRVYVRKIPNAEFLFSKINDTCEVYFAESCTAENDWNKVFSKIEKTESNVFSCDHIPFTCVFDGEDFFITNYDFSTEIENDGMIFAQKISDEFAVGKMYYFEKELAFKNGVGKLIRDKGWQQLEIKAQGCEEKSYSCDKREFRKIKKMNESEQFTFFDEKRILDPEKEKLAAHVSFQIKVSQCVQTINVPAPIYNEYKKFDDSVKKEVERIKKNNEKKQNEKDSAERSVANNNDKAEKAASEIKKFVEELKRIENRMIQNPQETKEETRDYKKDEKAANDVQTKLNKKEEELNQIKNNTSNLQTEIVNLDKEIAALQNTLDRAQKIPFQLKTVTECINAKDILQKIELSVPKFDLPKYGKLFGSGQNYEYVLNDDDNLDAAEEEMRIMGISDYVKFVDKK